MSRKIRSSFDGFINFKASKRKPLAQNINSLNRLRIGNKQRCLSCGGISLFGSKTVLQPIEREYRHFGNCSQIGKF